MVWWKAVSNTATCTAQHGVGRRRRQKGAQRSVAPPGRAGRLLTMSRDLGWHNRCAFEGTNASPPARQPRPASRAARPGRWPWRRRCPSGWAGCAAAPGPRPSGSCCAPGRCSREVPGSEDRCEGEWVGKRVGGGWVREAAGRWVGAPHPRRLSAFPTLLHASPGVDASPPQPPTPPSHPTHHPSPAAPHLMRTGSEISRPCTTRWPTPNTSLVKSWRRSEMQVAASRGRDVSGERPPGTRPGAARSRHVPPCSAPNTSLVGGDAGTHAPGGQRSPTHSHAQPPTPPTPPCSPP